MNRIIFCLAFILALSSSCSKKAKQPLLPHVIGGMNDVVIIMSPKNWESEPGKTVQSALSQSVPAIPQEEPIFDVIWMPHSGFSSSIKKQRNIILTKIGPEHKTKISYHKSLWAKTQIVVQISAPSSQKFIELFENNKEKIINRIQDAELERLINSYEKSQDASLREKIQNKHKLDVAIPIGYKINRETDNFIWLDNRHHNIIEGILIYYYPYTDTNTFTQDFQIEKRNSILKKYVSGEKEGSYPITEMRFPVESREYDLNGKTYTFELRGLWNIVDGLAMGGPFISITQYDEIHKRIVTVDGFLFAPGEDKRNLIRRIEAILYSLKFM